MYTDLKVVLKIDKEITEIMQSVGVRQGDNMAPVLFLFLMSAAAETLEPALRQANIEVLTVAHTPDDEIDTGYVRGHTPRMYTSRKLTAYEIYQLLYDNGASLFPPVRPSSKGLRSCIATLLASALKYTLDERVHPPRLNVFSSPPQFFDDIHSFDRALTADVENPGYSSEICR